MKARTELLLYRLAWLSGKAMRPTWRNLDSSFESWAYGSGLLRQIQRLEAQALIETKIDAQSGERMIRLTDHGLLACRPKLDPVERWSREWDGKWRMVIFDVPESDRPLRARMRRRLMLEGFGCLQKSVWISPSPFGPMIDELKGAKVEGGALTLWEATTAAGEKPEDMVREAWDFEAIGRRWQALSEHLELAKSPEKLGGNLWNWMAGERQLTRSCLESDPFLPEALLPNDYPGRSVWKKRGETLARIARIEIPG
jgi:phenylacetic acid degradation operon negative regulatory protein